MRKKLPILPPSPQKSSCRERFPEWLHRSLPKGATLAQTHQVLKKYGLNTVCDEAKCPNRMECYHKKTATFLALGKQCTRACSFCEIDFSKAPKAPEADEPLRIALSVKELGLKHVVITMVARDDLADQGASHLAKIIQTIREKNAKVSIEVLTSDFSGNWEALQTVLEERPEIFNHNIETVKRLSPKIRHKARYERTLELLQRAKQSKKCGWIKSGLMLGLGEEEEEVLVTLQDLHAIGCDILTMGQYLQPSRHKARVKAFVSPSQFQRYADYGLSLGIPYVYAGPWVRSSYNAHLLKKELSSSKIN